MKILEAENLSKEEKVIQIYIDVAYKYIVALDLDFISTYGNRSISSPFVSLYVHLECNDYMNTTIYLDQRANKFLVRCQ